MFLRLVVLVYTKLSSALLAPYAEARRSQGTAPPAFESFAKTKTKDEARLKSNLTELEDNKSQEVDREVDLPLGYSTSPAFKLKIRGDDGVPPASSLPGGGCAARSAQPDLPSPCARSRARPAREPAGSVN